MQRVVNKLPPPPLFNIKAPPIPPFLSRSTTQSTSSLFITFDQIFELNYYNVNYKCIKIPEMSTTNKITNNLNQNLLFILITFLVISIIISLLILILNCLIKYNCLKTIKKCVLNLNKHLKSTNNKTILSNQTKINCMNKVNLSVSNHYEKFVLPQINNIKNDKNYKSELVDYNHLMRWNNQITNETYNVYHSILTLDNCNINDTSINQYYSIDI